MGTPLLHDIAVYAHQELGVKMEHISDADTDDKDSVCFLRTLKRNCLEGEAAFQARGCGSWFANEQAVELFRRFLTEGPPAITFCSGWMRNGTAGLAARLFRLHVLILDRNTGDGGSFKDGDSIMRLV